MSASRVTSAGEVGALVAELRAWGITYLTTGEPLPEPIALLPVVLLQRLARCDISRVRDATIALLILHPALAEAIPGALADLEPDSAEQLVTLVLATLYLQRLWLTRLTLALGHPPTFPEQPFAPLWQTRELPAPAVESGWLGLYALVARERVRRALPLNFAGDWQNQIEHLLRQEWPHQRAHSVTLALPRPQSPTEGATSKEYQAMSMRPPVDRASIEAFLQRLGQQVRQPGRLYLVGGAELVYQQVRGPGATTLDIDLWLDVVDEDEVQRAIQQLKITLEVNVELASPGDFIPLPAAWQSQARYVGRYGPLEVFCFDYYSLALSKIERGNERDLQDVELLAHQGLIARDQLDAAYQEILPQVGHGRYFNLDATRFAAQYAAAMRRAWGN
jgi:hypothetical protein